MLTFSRTPNSTQMEHEIAESAQNESFLKENPCECFELKNYKVQNKFEVFEIHIVQIDGEIVAERAYYLLSPQVTMEYVEDRWILNIIRERLPPVLARYLWTNFVFY